MSIIQTRRRFISTLASTGLAGLTPSLRALAAEDAIEPPPETTTVRLPRQPVICFAPQYVCAELLRAEGFTDIDYVDIPLLAESEELGRFLAMLSMAGAAGVLSARPGCAAEGDLETRSVRIFANRPGICVAPQYIAEPLLRAEGFTDVGFVGLTSANRPSCGQGSGVRGRRFHGHLCRAPLGTSPSKKSVQRLKTTVGNLLVPGNNAPWQEVRDTLNRSLRGWSNYFCYGTRRSAFRSVDRYTYERVRDFLAKRHKVAGRRRTSGTDGAGRSTAVIRRRCSDGPDRQPVVAGVDHGMIARKAVA